MLLVRLRFAHATTTSRRSTLVWRHSRDVIGNKLRGAVANALYTLGQSVPCMPCLGGALTPYSQSDRTSFVVTREMRWRAQRPKANNKRHDSLTSRHGRSLSGRGPNKMIECGPYRMVHWAMELSIAIRCDRSATADAAPRAQRPLILSFQYAH